MKSIERHSLENHLKSLPLHEQKHIIDWLSQNISSKATALIETDHKLNQCPHCHCNKVKKWGYANGLQRYKCCDLQCTKTFNALTNTPLAKLRQRDKWFKYIECMIDSLPLRTIAKKLDIDLTTAFRWRHRFLKAPQLLQARQVSGIIEADETFFDQSFKGKRNITTRASRKRGGVGDKRKKGDQVSVLIVRDRSGHVIDCVLDSLSTKSIHHQLRSKVDKDSILCTDGASWYKTFAEEEGLSHHRLITLANKRVIGKAFHIQNVNAYISRLKTWMVRFRGVGTKYLPNYLGWMRLFETSTISEANWLTLALGKQHQTQT